MAIATWDIKQGDTRPILYATLFAGGQIIDLTSASSVKFTMTDSTGSVIVDLAACTIVNAAGGVVSYAWQSGDTDDAGLFQGEFKITWDDTSTQRVPNKGYFEVVITANLA